MSEGVADREPRNRGDGNSRRSFQLRHPAVPQLEAAATIQPWLSNGAPPVLLTSHYSLFTVHPSPLPGCQPFELAPERGLGR
jgi:hypothetical protein